MKKLIRLGALVLVIMMAAVGCGEKEKKEEAPAQELYPVTINGKEIRIGETKVQTLLDEGLRITTSEMTEDKQINEYEIDPEAELEPMTYYTGGSVWVTDSIYAHISIATDEEAVRMGDATIGRLEFSLISGEEDELKKITLNGVPVNEITREKAGEMFPDFTGDEHMWLQYGTDYEYNMSFDNDGNLTGFSLEKKYDVDWLGDKSE